MRCSLNSKMYLTNFFSEDKKFNLPQKNKVRSLIKKVCQSEKKKLGFINCVFCSDEYLLKINKKYLKHDTYTDIITFDYAEQTDNIEGDLYVSLDRINENAQKYKVDKNEELLRIIIHGLLHLIGYSDKSKKEKLMMSEKENKYLSLYKKM